MNNKTDVVLKIIKLLKLRDNHSATEGEKAAANEKIKLLCEKHNLKVEGKQIINLDSQQPIQQPLRNPVPNAPRVQKVTNTYVYYNGVKYYNGVPEEVWGKHDSPDPSYWGRKKMTN